MTQAATVEKLALVTKMHELIGEAHTRGYRFVLAPPTMRRMTTEADGEPFESCRFVFALEPNDVLGLRP